MSGELMTGELVTQTHRARRSVATGIHRVLIVIGILGILYVPISFLRDGVTSAALVFLLAMLVIGLSVLLARTLDIQRKLRRLTPQSAEIAPQPAPIEVKEQQRVSVPRGWEVTAGRVLAGVGADQLPVIGFAIVGMAADDVRRAVRELAQHQLVSASFKPLLILDEPHFGVARGYGYPAELIISARDWQGSHADRADYLQARLDSLRNSYGCTGVVRVPPSGLGDFGRAQAENLAAEWARRHKIVLPGTAPRTAPQTAKPLGFVDSSPITPRPVTTERSRT